MHSTHTLLMLNSNPTGFMFIILTDLSYTKYVTSHFTTAGGVGQVLNSVLNAPQESPPTCRRNFVNTPLIGYQMLSKQMLYLSFAYRAQYR